MKARNLGFIPLKTNISNILQPVLKKKLGKKDNFLMINNLQNNWQKIVGTTCFKFCHPKKVTFGKNKKSSTTLVISSYNSSNSFLLQSINHQIIENIASYYGHKIISEVRITQEPRSTEVGNIKEQIKILSPEEQIKFESKQQVINQLTNKINDQELQLVLQKLGTSILKKNA